MFFLPLCSKWSENNRQVEVGQLAMIPGLTFSVSAGFLRCQNLAGLVCLKLLVSVWITLYFSLSHCRVVMSSEFSGTEPFLEAISFLAKSYKVLKSGFLFQYNNFTLIQPQLSLEDCSPLSPVETRLQHLISAMYLELCMVLWEEQLLQEMLFSSRDLFHAWCPWASLLLFVM